MGNWIRNEGKNEGRVIHISLAVGLRYVTCLSQFIGSDRARSRTRTKHVDHCSKGIQLLFRSTLAGDT